MKSFSKTFNVCFNKKTKKYLTNCLFRGEFDIDWDDFVLSRVVKYCNTGDFSKVKEDLFNIDDDEWKELVKNLEWKTVVVETNWKFVEK